MSGSKMIEAGAGRPAVDPAPTFVPRVRVGLVPDLVAVAAWAGLIAVAHIWGRQLIDAGHRLQLGPGPGAPPIVGSLDLRFGFRAVPAVVAAGAAVAWGPAVAARLGWRRLLAAAAVAAAGFAVALAAVDAGGLTRGLLGRGEYLHDVARVGSPLAFLDGFTERLPSYHTHVQGHPPAMPLLLWTLDRAGLGGAGWAAALVIAGGAAAVPATLVAVRAIAGEALARTAAPFLVVAPAAIWVASSADALYMGLTATGISLLALAGAPGGRNAAPQAAVAVTAGVRRRRPPPRPDVLAAGAGALLGTACFFTYGAVLAAPVAAGVALAQRRWRPLAVAAVAALAVAGAFAAAGFWWPDGLAATRRAYGAGVASRRPYSYFLVANLAAFAIAAGPAAAVALVRLRRAWTGRAAPAAGRAALLVAGAAAGVALADLSGLSKGEVERIWLPFVPWVVAATALLPPAARVWLGLQAGAALVVAAGVRTPW